MFWFWNLYVMELKGDNVVLFDVIVVNGDSYFDNGLYVYGILYWGNCC